MIDSKVQNIVFFQQGRRNIQYENKGRNENENSFGKINTERIFTLWAKCTVIIINFMIIKLRNNFKRINVNKTKLEWKFGCTFTKSNFQKRV